jgi:hypothetical protein
LIEELQGADFYLHGLEDFQVDLRSGEFDMNDGRRASMTAGSTGITDRRGSLVKMKKATSVGSNHIYTSYRRPSGAFRRPNVTIYLQDSHVFDEYDDERSGDWEDDVSAMEDGRISADLDPISASPSLEEHSPPVTGHSRPKDESRNERTCIDRSADKRLLALLVEKRRKSKRTNRKANGNCSWFFQ